MARRRPSEWNSALRDLGRAEDELAAARALEREHHAAVDLDHLRAVAKTFPSVWRDRKTAERDRKRMVRLLIEDATILKGEQITLYLRFRSRPYLRSRIESAK